MKSQYKMKKILIIDDQEDNLISIGALLKSYIPDCEILTALAGQKGIDIAVNEHPDTILLDIIMPEMDGYETCRKLKNNVASKHIPVIMLTAIKTDPASRVKGLNFGADAFLSKPVDSAELSAQVNVMFRIKEAEEKLRAEKDVLDEKFKARTEELREKERNYRTLINNLPGFVYRCQNDQNWTMIYISAGCKDITGYLPGDFINNKNIAFNDIIDPNFRQEIYEKWKKVLAEKKTFEFEYPIITKNKDVRWVWERGCGIYSDEGKLLFLEGFITDVTDSKHAEKKVEEQNEFLNTVLESLTHPFYVINANDYTIEMANSAAGNISGDEKLTCHSLTHHRDKPCQGDEHICPLETVKTTKKTVVVKHIHFDKEGNKKNIEVHGFPVFDSNGNVIQIIEYCLDITDRLKAEDKLKGKMNELQIFYDATIDREIKMIELKKEINKLLEKKGDGTKYEIPV